jgi:NAD(P)-dependent dehydrogenase (short-subunit alcohol dehydrogenase family)
MRKVDVADKDKHILICGGTSRAGLDAARLLVKDGFKCIVAGRGPLEQENGLHFEAVDFSLPDSVTKFCERISEFNIDTCVFFQRSRGEDILKSVQVSVVSSLEIIKTLETVLISNRGSILFIGSIIGKSVGMEQTAAYHISKGALGPIVRFLAVKYGINGVRTNLISLATLKHSCNERGYMQGSLLDDITRKLIPIRRPTEVIDIVEAIKFLSTPSAGAITGQEIHLDGGLGVLSQVSSAIQALS